MEKVPNLSLEKIEDGWCVGIAEDGIDIYMDGDTEEEAYRAFWGYLYALIPDLEKEKHKLSNKVKRQKDYLREHFKYTQISHG